MHNSQNQKLIELLNFLEGLLPASTILVVGAGSTIFDPESLCSNADAIHLCEPESGRAHKLKMRYNLLTQIFVHNCLIADKNGPTKFHLTSLEAADGLVNPEQLRSIWKNIRLEKQLECEAKTIPSFLADIGEGATPDWLIIDCLRAPDILAAAGSLLEEVDVVVLRLTTANTKKEGSLYSTGQSYLETLDCLAEFRSVATIPSSNPAVFHKVFAKDWKHKVAIEFAEQIQTLETSVRAAKSELETVRSENRKIKDELSTAKSELENFQELENKIQAIEASEQAAKSAMENAQAEMEVLKETLATSNTNYQGLVDKLQVIKNHALKDQSQLQKEKRLLENNLEDSRKKIRELAEQRLADEEQWKQILARLERITNPMTSDENTGNKTRAAEISKMPEKSKTHTSKRGKSKQESRHK